MFGVQKTLMSFMCHSCTKQQQRFIERSPSPFRCRCPQGILMWRPAAPWRLAQQSWLVFWPSHSSWPFRKSKCKRVVQNVSIGLASLACNMQCRSKWNGMMMPTLGWPLFHYAEVLQEGDALYLPIGQVPFSAGIPVFLPRKSVAAWIFGELERESLDLFLVKSPKNLRIFRESLDEHEFRRHKQFDVIDTMQLVI